jgi:hypothetical protein
MIFKIFSPNILAKMFGFFAHTTARFRKDFFHNIDFREKHHFFAENWQKLAKIGKNWQKL